ncbi:unnamed protein product [Adineta ricciae]|uniref:Ubiquitin-like protease family profile domain-containing protein n=1 Tax=Adineta ricciae TaxID=249248 RepID=A0A815I9T0_ADIRI|nr:unnamed protein product [Adineta ricciae]
MSASLESDPILVSYHDSIVRVSNLKTLDDSNWLDDSIITFAFEYLQYDSKFAQHQSNSCVFVSPSVVQLLKMSDDSFADQLLQSIDFLEKKFLILPINDNRHVNAFAGSHWSLLILAIQDKVLYHFDSMSSANDRTAKDIQSKLRVFFHTQVPLVNGRCPQQENGFDCGFYENDLSKSPTKEGFEKFMNEINRCITSESINQRRKQLKTLLESMSSDRKA